MSITKRVIALECKGASSNCVRVHQLSAGNGQTEDEAIEAYGRERIGPNDLAIVLMPVSPRFDADGNMILFKDWPENQQVEGAGQAEA